MADLAGVLGRVPGLAGYLGARQLQQQEGAQELQQVGALAQLQAQMQNQQGQAQNRQRQESARQAIAALGPDATEDQRVNALLPHIGDPDKIAGILQNASLKKSQQEQTKQIALSRLAQQASQHMQDLQVRQQNARTAEERSNWERQAANVRLGFQRQAAEIQAGRFSYDTGMIAPQVTPYAAPTGPVAAPAVQPAPTPAPAPGPAPAASPADFPRQGRTEGRDAQMRIIQGEIATEEQLALENQANPQQAEVHRLNAEKLRSELSKLGPATANNLDARDLKLAGSPQPQATPQPAPQAAPREIVMPPEIARLPKKAQDAWMAEQVKKQGDSKNRVLDEKAIEDERKRGLRLTLQNDRANLVLNKVDEALDKVGFFSTGTIGGVSKYIPNTPAYNLDKTVDTIKANIGFQELQAMREASPTGGALGQVAVQELNMLQAVIGSLEVGQDSNQLRKNLGAVKTHYENWKKVMSQAEAARIPKVGAVVDGHRFKGGDPSKPASWEKL